MNVLFHNMVVYQQHNSTLEVGWKVIEVKSIVTIVIIHFDGRIRVVHVNRLHPYNSY